MSAEPDHSCLFQSVNERPEQIKAEIRGDLPSWLKGTLIRNGPGKFECGDIPFNHWFDGQGLLHRFHIADGHVMYSNKFVRSESYADSISHGDSYHVEFGTYIPPDPCKNIFARFFSFFWASDLPADNTLVNVFMMKDKMYATTESNFLYEIDPKTLDTLKRVDITTEFQGEVTINSATAHPHQTSDGSVINISTTYGRDSTYKIIQIPPSSGKADEKPLEGGKVLCTISATSGLGYFHSFCLTDNYVVVTEQPLMINIWRALTRRFFSSWFENWLYWDANQLVRFHIIDRKDGNRVGVFTAEPFFVFHHINAFERDEKIYLDACCYHDNSIIKQLYLKNLRSPAEPGQKKLDVPDVRRYEIPLGELYDADTEKPLHKGSDGLDYSSLYSGIELPRINYEEFNGKPYRFVYGVASSTHTTFRKLIKLNVETRKFVEWQESGAYPSEPVFVKAPDGKAEDDGVILSCVINPKDQTTSLVVLDAKELKELGRGVIQGVTPANFHGLFQ
ncbi:unnamed protein product [Porites evermanni]|uniref:Uncharacterized protein n=1 Tax=Porites evermanni TaxID=104178 RepID=A0ABN8RU57_9CNID|nr:unnamed protein product [Porites evermanni]